MARSRRSQQSLTGEKSPGAATSATSDRRIRAKRGKCPSGRRRPLPNGEKRNELNPALFKSGSRAGIITAPQLSKNFDEAILGMTEQRSCRGLLLFCCVFGPMRLRRGQPLYHIVIPAWVTVGQIRQGDILKIFRNKLIQTPPHGKRAAFGGVRASIRAGIQAGNRSD